MKGSQGTSPFANEYPFSDCQYILFKSPNHPQWSSQMRQLNSGSQTPLNCTFCLNPLIFRLWVLKAHQRYLVPWAPFFFKKRRPPAHSFLPLISCGRERERETVGSGHFSSRLWFLCQREKFPMCFQKKKKKKERLAPWKRSLQFPVVSPPI